MEYNEKLYEKPLIYAVIQLSYQEMRTIHRTLQTNVDEKDSMGCTALSVAAWYGKHRMAKYLIKQGADVNTKDNHGLTPLLCACECNHYNVAKLLLKHGADVEVCDAFNNATPMKHAVYNENKKMIKLLKEYICKRS